MNEIKIRNAGRRPHSDGSLGANGRLRSAEAYDDPFRVGEVGVGLSVGGVAKRLHATATNDEAFSLFGGAGVGALGRP